VLLGSPWPSYLEAHRHPELVHERFFALVSTAATPAEAVRQVLDRTPATR
jgi:hypothetical protein